MATRIPAYLRLMELADAAGDWRALGENARRLLAVNPLIPAPFRGLARASEELGLRDEAIGAYRCSALLDDTDPAGCTTAWPACSAKPASRRRPGVRCSSRSSRRHASAKPTNFLLELLEHEKPALPTPKDSPTPTPR